MNFVYDIYLSAKLQLFFDINK